MVLVFPVPPATIASLQKEVEPLLSRLIDYSTFQEEPKVLFLRNPGLSPYKYQQWQKDHRFGILSCPGPHDEAWGPVVARVVQKTPCPSDLRCISAMIICYSKPYRNVGYHRDPSAYRQIVSYTLNGEGVMKVRHGNQKGVAYNLVPSSGVLLEEVDCLYAKHSIQSSRRLGLVLRYVDKECLLGPNSASTIE